MIHKGLVGIQVTVQDFIYRRASKERSLSLREWAEGYGGGSKRHQRQYDSSLGDPHHAQAIDRCWPFHKKGKGGSGGF